VSSKGAALVLPLALSVQGFDAVGSAKKVFMNKNEHY